MAIDIARRNAFRALAQAAAEELEAAQPTEILEWAYGTFGERMVVASSMADAVIVDLASRVAPNVNVAFLDTGYHFDQTLATRDAVASRYAIKLHTIQPLQTVSEQDQLFGSALYARDPNACCNLRKVEPLRRALEPYDAWISGLRRDEAASRSRVDVVEWDESRSLVKVNPIATWTQDEVEGYVQRFGVVLNPLLSEGYLSIGCEPCTARVALGADPRSGRWVGHEKTECGLHVDADGRLRPGPSN